MLNKTYLIFGVSAMFFLSILIYSAFILVTWDVTPDTGLEDLEINLPVIDWERYLNLSKHIE